MKVGRSSLASDILICVRTKKNPRIEVLEVQQLWLSQAYHGNLILIGFCSTNTYSGAKTGWGEKKSVKTGGVCLEWEIMYESKDLKGAIVLGI